MKSMLKYGVKLHENKNNSILKTTIFLKKDGRQFKSFLCVSHTAVP
jgi:hypothetical protein